MSTRCTRTSRQSSRLRVSSTLTPCIPQVFDRSILRQRLGCSNMRPAGRWRWREVYVVLGRPVRKLTHREFTGLLASWNPFRAGDESSGLCDQDRGGIRQQYATASLPSPEKHCLFCLFGKECSTWDSITAAIACGTTSVTALVAGSLDRSQYLYSI
jgi:hypothetical protein